MARKTFALLLLIALVAVQFTEVSATPAGVSIMGDSGSQEYRCNPNGGTNGIRGDATSFNWSEVLERVRGVDFGPLTANNCQPYNHAWSGETVMVNMTSRTTEVLEDYSEGSISKVIIMLGHNDLYGNPELPDVPPILDRYRTNLDRLLNAGILPGNILLVDVSQENWNSPLKAKVDEFNLGLRRLANEKGTWFTSWEYFHTESNCRYNTSSNTYNVGGHTITNTYGDEFHNWRVADGHLGSMANGLLSNAMMVDFLGIPRMTDAELLALVGAEEISSNPPPVCQPAPTLTPLPAVTSGPTLAVSPTSTPLPTFTFTPTLTGILPTATATRTMTSTATGPTTTPTVSATASSGTIRIGETNIQSVTYSGIGNRLIAQQVTLSQNAWIQSLSYYVATAGGQLRLGIYNNSGSNPGSLMAETAAFTPVTGWNTQPVLTSTLLPAGTYWLAFLPQSNTLAGRVIQSGVGRHYTYTFGSLPGTFSSSPTNDVFRFSFYATLSTQTASTGTPTFTPVSSNTPSQTPLPSDTATFTPLPSNTASSTPSYTPVASDTSTNTPLSSATPSRTPTNTALPSATPSHTLTNTALPSATPSRTPTSSPSNTPTRTPTTSGSSTITIGETRILSLSYSGLGNRLVAQQVTLSQSATIQSLSYYVSAASGQLRLGIYNNNSNNPGTLVAETAAFTPVAGWNTQPVLTQTILPAGTYWLAFLPQNNTLAGRVTQSGVGRHYTYTFGPMPGSYSSSPVSDVFHFSLYATLKP